MAESKDLPVTDRQRLHTRFLSDTNDGGLKDARDEENNIIISDSTFFSLLPPQFKKIRMIQVHVWLLMLYFRQNYTFIIAILAWYIFENMKDKSQNSQSRRFGEKAHHIYETFQNTVIPHGRHIYAK